MTMMKIRGSHLLGALVVTFGLSASLSVWSADSVASQDYFKQCQHSLNPAPEAMELSRAETLALLDAMNVNGEEAIETLAIRRAIHGQSEKKKSPSAIYFPGMGDDSVVGEKLKNWATDYFQVPVCEETTSQDPIADEKGLPRGCMVSSVFAQLLFAGIAIEAVHQGVMQYHDLTGSSRGWIELSAQYIGSTFGLFMMAAAPSYFNEIEKTTETGKDGLRLIEFFESGQARLTDTKTPFVQRFDIISDEYKMVSQRNFWGRKKKDGSTRYREQLSFLFYRTQAPVKPGLPNEGFLAIRHWQPE